MARGSITPRPTKDGKARYRIKWSSIGPDGKRHHHSETLKTKKAAEAFLAEKLDEVEKGAFVVASKETVSAYLDRWLKAMAPGWSEATTYQYTAIVRNRIKPQLGDVPLARLDELAIQECYANFNAAGYSRATVKLTHAVLSRALSQAVAWKVLTRNPAHKLTVPSPIVTAPTVWDADEAAAFLTDVKDHRFAPLWRLSLDSGMRIGEILALDWRDLDLDAGVVSVRRTLTRTTDGGYKLGDLAKTSGSQRAIILGRDTVRALRPLRAEQNTRRLQCGAAWTDLGLVFDRGDGSWITPMTVSSSFRRAVKKARVPPLKLHGMRHTMATLLLAAGIHPKIVQERLGHRTIQMTLDRYSHVTPSMQKDAADALNRLLGNHARPKRGHGAS